MADKDWLARLVAAGPVLLDGAWGTQFQLRGLAVGESPDFWNLHHPERVEAVARSYVEAGSQIILTNTFRANRLAQAGHPELGRLAEVNREGVLLSKRAAAGRARVFASMGPSGKLLLTGQVDRGMLRDAFAEQAHALAAAGPDAIVLETFCDLEEVACALEAAHATGLPVVACLVFDSGRDGDRTLMGVTPEEAAARLVDLGADVVGANCGNGIAGYVPICRRLAGASDRPIWIKANAGIPVIEAGQIVYRTTPAEFAEAAGALAEAGADFIGGCCGTTPAFIAAVRERLRGRAGTAEDAR